MGQIIKSRRREAFPRSRKMTLISGGKRRQIKKPYAIARCAKPVVTRDWKHPAAIGYALIIFTFVVLGGWSAVAKLDSAVTAPGDRRRREWSQVRPALRRRYR